MPEVVPVLGDPIRQTAPVDDLAKERPIRKRRRGLAMCRL
jgi:hypothetical protein